ncbi:DUF3347 domain-containing protein [Muriicola soli]|uniref:DUF3347 domain-containing protein n=1 Tax=Muriicola soli TaxID=2507538 RepID=A0A411EAG8_9FLAO|nr:DUF3347 domain-containing protein [Muriicola soli]QBA64533.1 DUF3347 domain-containing protein [Muriicola soli]
MKTLKKTNILAFILTVLVFSCKENKTSNLEKSNDQLSRKILAKEATKITFNSSDAGDIFERYIELRNALIESDAVKASKVAMKFDSIEGGDYEKINEVALLIGASDELDSQRLLFSELTTLLEPVIKDQLAGGAVYKQYCPMAFNNDGATWLSSESVIRNPYFGSKMLNCGKITETYTE